MASFSVTSAARGRQSKVDLRPPARGRKSSRVEISREFAEARHDVWRLSVGYKMKVRQMVWKSMKSSLSDKTIPLHQPFAIRTRSPIPTKALTHIFMAICKTCLIRPIVSPSTSYRKEIENLDEHSLE